MSLNCKIGAIFVFWAGIFLLLCVNSRVIYPLETKKTGDIMWTNFRFPTRFGHISVEDGLSQSSVMCIFQDSKGFMWFGTEDGLNRYDGYNFTIYRSDPGNPYSPNNNRIFDIYEDQTGTLWIGTSGGGLNKFDRKSERFFHYQEDENNPFSLSDNNIYSIYEDRSGHLWFCTLLGGLNKLVPGEKEGDPQKFIAYQHDPGNPHSLGGNTIRCIYQDRDGGYWIGRNGGLDKLVPGKNENSPPVFIHYTSVETGSGTSHIGDVMAINEDNDGILWIGTQKGLYSFDRNKEKFTRYEPDPGDVKSISHHYIRRIYKDRAGVLWIGTDGGGLNKMIPAGGEDAPPTFIRYQHNAFDPGGLTGNGIEAIYEDRSGVLWVGVYSGGVHQLILRGTEAVEREKAQFLNIQSNPADPGNSLSHNNVSAICIDGRGAVWVGTDGGGLNKIIPPIDDNSAPSFLHYAAEPGNPAGLSNNIVLTLCEDHLGNIWIGTYLGGLNQLIPGKSKNSKPTFVHYRHDPKDPGSLSLDFVFSVYEDHLGDIWVGTMGGGLNRLDRKTGKFTRFQSIEEDPATISVDTLNTIYEDSSHVLWVGTTFGLSRFNRETQTFIRYMHDPDNPRSISNNYVSAIYQDTSGVLWFGTDGGGLNKFVPANKEISPPEFIHYRQQHGLPNDTISNILEDDRGNLWLSTNKGLSCFSPKTGEFKNYDVSDGLQGNEFTAGAVWKTAMGDFFLGGKKGISIFRPERLKDNTFVPPVIITGLRIFNEPITVGKWRGKETILQESISETREITLSYTHTIFSFQFTALNFIAPEKNEYAYKMEGLKDKWNYVGNKRFATYTTLPPGDYTFRVKASNNDGVWNEEGVALKIKIIPPFWKTWWFYLSCILVFIFSGFFIFRFRVNRLRQRKKELEQLVNRRTGQLKQANKELETLSIAASKTDNAVMIMDADGDIEWVNEGFTRMYGMTLEKFLSLRGKNILQASLHPNIKEIIGTCIKEKKSLLYETHSEEEFGDILWFQSTLTPIYDKQGDLTKLVIIDADITRIKKSEEAAEFANRAKSEFLARMSHEIRTPMNAIIGFTDLLLDADLNGEQLDFTRTIHQSGEALISLLNDILDFSKIEAGELIFEPDDFDPEETVFNVLELIYSRIGGKPIEVFCRIGDHVPVYVKSDEGRFRQVLLNLMSNAVKFTEAGEIEISLDVEEKEKNRLKLHLTVRDSGIGIPEDKLESIFDVFQQADGSITKRYGGTGLGLAICKQIAIIMGGDVWAESRAGKGSIFHFTAWVDKSDKKPGKKISGECLEGKKVLVIDDNPNNLTILAHVLEFQAMRVVTMENPGQAIATIKESFEKGDPFDIAAIDIQMPEISGYGLAKQIRNLDSPLSTLPLLAISSYSANHSNEYTQAGFDGYLLKPVNRKKMLQMMERLLGKKEPGKKKKQDRDPRVTLTTTRDKIKQSIHILLAEDNLINQKLIRFMLTEEVYGLTVVENGREAVDAYTSKPDNFDLIFMDIQMPVMDGKEATRLIRKKGFHRIPIIALTAESMKGDRESCLEAGMNDYIAKPIRREVVFRMVEKWCTREADPE
jgi:PAS domain S-box-containing protein